MSLSATVRSATFIVVVVPWTVKSPVITRSPDIVPPLVKIVVPSPIAKVFAALATNPFALVAS